MKTVKFVHFQNYLKKQQNITETKTNNKIEENNEELNV